MFDNELVFSDKQAITASAASTNYIEENACINVGQGMMVEVLVTTDFACGTADSTVNIAVQRSSESTFADPDTLIEREFVFTDLVTGADPITIPVPFDPNRDNKFTRLYFTNSADMTAGALTAVLVPYAHTNDPATVA